MPATVTLSVSAPDGTPVLESAAVEAAVDSDIQAFNTFFQKLGNSSLVGAETAAIKTYLAWKLRVAQEKT